MKNNPFEQFGNLGTLNTMNEEYEHHANSETKDVLDEPEVKPSFTIFYLVCTLCLIVFSYRLLDLQVAQGAKFQYLAEGNRIRSRDISAPRGIIYDRKDKIITKDTASYNLDIYPADFPYNPSDRTEIYRKIEEISGIPQSEIIEKVEHVGLYSVEPITLKEDIPRDEALSLIVKYNNISGVEISARPNRRYENIPGLSHILGYIGKISPEELEKKPDYKMSSWIGKTGIELTYEDKLKGNSGKEQVEVDSRGRIQRDLARLDSEPGSNLYLGIDADLQKEIASYLGEKLKEVNVSSGVVVAIDPRDGAVLAMVSLPSYDNNIFTSKMGDEYKKLTEDPNKPMINRAISGLYPSGSTIKPFIASAALNEKVISENTTINDTGEIRVGEWAFPDWKVHGLTNVRKAIAESCDVFFYALGGGWDKIGGLGVDRMKKYLNLFGFGEVTNIDIPGEESGLIPDAAWKKKVKKEPWYLGDSYHLAIGQGDLLVTPLQLANATAAIANGGELLKPHFVIKETDYLGNVTKEYQKEIIRKDFIDSYSLQVVREGMRQTVTSGSARSLNELSSEVAGKTGTAEFGEKEVYHAWFTAFAPYDNPRIALAVLVERGGEGSDVSVPIAKRILEWYFANRMD